MNQVIENIKTRRSIRKFKPDPVPKEMIDEIMEAGIYAASGKNTQTPVIIALTNKEIRSMLGSVNSQIAGWGKNFDGFYGAPVVLIVLAKKDMFTHVYDGSLVLGNMMLAAHSLGLGSCWIHRAKEEFEREEGKEILSAIGLDDSYEGIGHLAIGYVKGEEPPTPERLGGRMFYIE